MVKNKTYDYNGTATREERDIEIQTTVRMRVTTKRGTRLYIQTPVALGVHDNVVQDALGDMVQDLKDLLSLP